MEVKEKPLVSIIINCFNGEDYLDKALDSVIAQTYGNWEIIFWDNKSTDRSAEIFKSYKDNRLKYYLAPQHSKILYEARNYALEKANGDFIAFLDADDWWLPEKLEKQLLLFKDPKVGLVYGNLWYYFQKQHKKKILSIKTLPSGMILNELLNKYVIRLSTIVIRKKSLKNFKYYFNDRFHIIGDFDLSIRLAEKWKLNCVQKPIAFLRIHGKNETLLNKNKEINELKVWYEEVKNNPIFLSNKAINQIPLKILYLETLRDILGDKFINNISKVIKYPFGFNKIKLIVALFLPKFILEKIKSY